MVGTHHVRSPGAVGALWRFPVKSMAGEQLDAVEVAAGGIVGDRGYALVDNDTGKVASAKHPKKWPQLLNCRATYVESPRVGEDLPAARIDLPDGTSVRTDTADVDAALSAFFGRSVTLSRSAPADFTIEEYVPDEADLRPDGYRDQLTEQRLGAAFFDERGLPAMVPDGSFFDLMPISVLTSSTMDRLGELQPGSSFDVRRFRMNLIMRTTETGFVENSWIGRSLSIGQDVRLSPTFPVPRCVMTTLAQDELPRDPNILKTTARHNRLDVAGAGLYPCAGIYAVVTAPGTIRTGDAISAIAA